MSEGKNESEKPVVVDHWILSHNTRIIGDAGISTSPIIAYKDGIVTTRSGSEYKLGKPHVCMYEEVFLAGCATPEETVKTAVAVKELSSLHMDREWEPDTTEFFNIDQLVAKLGEEKSIDTQEG